MTDHRIVLTGGPLHDGGILVPTSRLHMDIEYETFDPAEQETRRGVFGLFRWAGWR